MCGVKILLAIYVIIAYLYIYFWRKTKSTLNGKIEKRQKELKNNKRKFNEIINDISAAEEKTHNILKLYEINRKLAQILNIDDLLNTFTTELNRMKYINNVYISEQPLPEENKTKNNLNFHIKSKTKQWYLSLECLDRLLREQLPHLISQLKLLLDRAAIYQKLQKISITDSLTSLPNKRHFMDRYNEEFLRSDKFNFDLTFFMIDIDHFKKHNDTYGHLVGDEILRILAEILKNNIREIDFPGRFGGEEFSIFFPQTTKQQALPIAKRLRKEVEKYKFSVYDEEINLTISIGISSYPEDTKSKGQLIENTDQALYKAKEQGRNRICTFTKQTQ